VEPNQIEIRQLGTIRNVFLIDQSYLLSKSNPAIPAFHSDRRIEPISKLIFNNY
jgi:hypothetical protein